MGLRSTRRNDGARRRRERARGPHPHPGGARRLLVGCDDGVPRGSGRPARSRPGHRAVRGLGDGRGSARAGTRRRSAWRFGTERSAPSRGCDRRPGARACACRAGLRLTAARVDDARRGGLDGGAGVAGTARRVLPWAPAVRIGHDARPGLHERRLLDRVRHRVGGGRRRGPRVPRRAHRLGGRTRRRGRAALDVPAAARPWRARRGIAGGDVRRRPPALGHEPRHPHARCRRRPADPQRVRTVERGGPVRCGGTPRHVRGGARSSSSRG